MTSSSRIVASWAGSILGFVLTSGWRLGAEPPAAFPATVDSAWNAVFTRDSGWTGADVAGTVDLEDGRVLWSFGDTWVGKVIGNAHADAHLVNNSVAIQTNLDAARRGAPEKGDLAFYWGAVEKGQPRAWLVPAPASDGVRPAGKRSYWFTGGGVMARGPAGKPQLALFLFDVATGLGGGDGVWDFEVRGGHLATVDDISGAPDTWRVEPRAIPFSIGAQDVRRDPSLRSTAWGLAAFREPASEMEIEQGGPREYVYIYGIRGVANSDQRLLLARAPADRLVDFSTWRFFAARGRWSAQAADAADVARDMSMELSVERMRVGDRSVLVMVHSEPPLGGGVLLRVGLRPEGPWSAPIMIYSAPEIERDKPYFAYAAKGHAPLSAPGTVLVSYLVNSHDFNAMYHDASIYRPRFVRLPLDAERVAELVKNVDSPPGVPAQDAPGGK